MLKWLPLLVLFTCQCLQQVEGFSLFGHASGSPTRTSAKFPCKQVNATFVDCRRLSLTSIPAGIPRSTEILLLSHNKLHIFNSTSLAGLVNLRLLNMSYNTISKFKGGSYFPDQAKLEHLYLSNNQINKIPEDSFASLSRLQTLDLSMQNNGLMSGFPDFLRPLSGTLTTLLLAKVMLMTADFGERLSLKSLKVLSLAENRFSDLGKSDLQALSGAHLETLDLSHNSISTINTKFFSPLAEVTTLDLTSFTRKPQPLLIANVSKAASVIKIQKLVLCSLRLTSVNPSMFESLWNSTLKELDLSFNQIAELGDDSFGSSLAQLEELNLFSNSIASISPKSLSGLTHLKTLDMDGNHLTEITPGSFEHNSSLQRLYLSDNSITALSPEGSFKGLINLEVLHLSQNKISQTFNGGEFQDLGELRYLDLSRSKMNSGHIALTDSAFIKVPKLKYLNLKKVSLKDIASVPSPFDTLSELQFLDISNNNMDSFQVDTFGALKSLETLYLDHNHFDNMWHPQYHQSPSLFLKGLVSLRILDLSFNGFQSVPEAAFHDLAHLKTLHLSNNKLSAISGRVFDSLKELEYLDLHKNNINVVNETMLAPILKTLKGLSICGNPFSCSCQQEWFRNWIDDAKVKMVNLSLCLCNSPPEWRNKPLMSFYPDDYNCDGKLPLRYWICIGVGSFLLLLFIVNLIVYRWKVYYVFMLVRARHRRSKRKHGYEELYDYDAFISYSAADKEWVTEQLIPELESGENPFTLCHHERDFEPGKEIVDNIIESVDRSRRTICIISKKYLESNWCKYERRVTMNKLFVDYKDVLILIILEDIPDKKMSKYDLIHRAVKKKTYLKWPAGRDERDVFWQRLKYTLSEDRTPENNEVVPINA